MDGWSGWKYAVESPVDGGRGVIGLEEGRRGVDGLIVESKRDK